MSYCAIITFRDGLPDWQIEFRNAWGGAARIWTPLWDKYLKDHTKKYDSWLTGNQQRLWDLAKTPGLPMYERAVHVSTFDCFYVKAENFPRFCADLRAFDAAYPVTGQVNHLPAWADKISTLQIEAVGFHGTSVAENPWSKWDGEKGEVIPVHLSQASEVYEGIEFWALDPAWP
jgi:hypothetical protein